MAGNQSQGDGVEDRINKVSKREFEDLVDHVTQIRKSLVFLVEFMR
jgi:hypothetical protein